MNSPIFTVIDGKNQDLDSLFAKALFGDDHLEIERLSKLLQDRRLTTPVLVSDNSEKRDSASPEN